MSGAGIDYSVTANFAPPKILHENNLWTLNAAASHPNPIPLVSFHPSSENVIKSHFEVYMKLGAKGVKLRPMSQGFDPREPSLDMLYRLCAERGIPVVFHYGRVSNARINAFSDTSSILPVLDMHPTLKVVLTHMADGNSDDVVRIAHEYENAYFDTSIIMTGYPELLKYNNPNWPEDSVFIDILAQTGSGRLIFGSDWPWGSAAHDVERFLKMQISDDDKRLILSGNAACLFNQAVSIDAAS